MRSPACGGFEVDAGVVSGLGLIGPTTGGAGGIGYTAIQLAKAFGAYVFTTVAGPDQIEAVKKLGADVALDYATQDWAREIENLVGRRGIDCILDFVGGAYIQKNLKLLARNGRLVQIAFMQGAKVELDLSLIHISEPTRPY